MTALYKHNPLIVIFEYEEAPVYPISANIADWRRNYHNLRRMLLIPWKEPLRRLSGFQEEQQA